MAIITRAERDKLFLKIKHECGFPLRPFQVTDEMMVSYLEMVIEDYSSLVNEWLIEQQWVSMQNMEVDSLQFFNAYTTKSTDFMRSFTYAYSKQVGLGTNAPAARGWELKRDFITISAYTQHYIIPAGREINEVLWETPAAIDKANVDPMALGNWTSNQFGWGYLGRPAQYVQPTYSLLLAAQDRRMKERVLQSPLSYRITGLETGEKVLHLYPIPGSDYEIRDAWGKHCSGRILHYFYYDTNGGEDRDTCLAENKDIIKLPSDVPVDVLQWDEMNTVAKQQVRDLLIAKTKMGLGSIRGYFSGELSISDEKTLTMDYRHLLDEGVELKKDTITNIRRSLDKLSQVNLTEERAKIAENVNRERSYQPFRVPLKYIG